MERIGVFLCHCSLKAAGDIKVQQVIQSISRYDRVAYVIPYEDMCISSELELVRDAIKEKRLDGIVLTSCSPSLHLECFRNVIVSEGLSTYQLEVAGLKEGGDWNLTEVEATQRVIQTIKASIDRLQHQSHVSPSYIPITKRALVIGGGIAGIQTALDIADGGYEVLLVEKTSSIGGHMIQYSEVFPTLDCPQCIETPKMVECWQNPNIEILAYSEVEEISGEIGNFTVKIRKKASYVDWTKCNGCGLCIQKCLTQVPADYDRLPFGHRKAIYIPFAQAVPNKPIIDREHCGYFTTGTCQVCSKICPREAVDYSQKDTFIDINVGAIILATGFELMSKKEISEYDDDLDIIDGIQFERLLSPGGPTAGEVLRPSDGKTPREVVFISCVGSRDPEHFYPYCSKVCCMYLAKMAMLYKHAVPDGQAYIFYIDIRSTGKGYEEFIQRAVEEDHVVYLRGRVSRLFRENDKIKVYGVDTLSGRTIVIDADLVVLGMAMVPSLKGTELIKKLNLKTDKFGFLSESHFKMRPMESLKPGIFIAGTSQSPKDIPDTVAQASAAASKVLILFAQEMVIQEYA